MRCVGRIVIGCALSLALVHVRSAEGATWQLGERTAVLMQKVKLRLARVRGKGAQPQSAVAPAVPSVLHLHPIKQGLKERGFSIEYMPEFHVDDHGPLEGATKLGGQAPSHPTRLVAHKDSASYLIDGRTGRVLRGRE